MRSAYSASVCTMQTRKHHIDSLPLVVCERYIPTIKVKGLLCFDYVFAVQKCLHNSTINSLVPGLYCKRWKGGWGLGMRLLHLDKPPAPLTSLLKLQFAFLRKRDIEDGTAWFINRLILLSCSFLARTHSRVYLVHLLSTRYTHSVPTWQLQYICAP